MLNKEKYLNKSLSLRTIIKLSKLNSLSKRTLTQECRVSKEAI